MFQREIITLGQIAIHWYGVIALIAYISASVYIKRLARSSPVTVPLDNLIFYATIWGLIGARAYHVLNELPFYLDHPLFIPAIWRGGLAIHGGLIAGACVIGYYAKKYKHSFLDIADVLFPGLILGQAIGRWGNFFNQELFGRPTALPWGIFIDPVNRPLGYEEFTRFHPTFCYEFLWGGVVVTAITFWIKKKRPKKSGVIFGAALIAWAFGRVISELLRIDTTPILFGIRLPLLMSLTLIVIGIGELIWILQKNRAVKV